MPKPKRGQSARLRRYTSTFDGGTVVYWRPIDGSDIEAVARAEECNALDVHDELRAYNEACATGTAGAVKTEVEEVNLDG